ncbi:MAG: hypothetical protein Q7T58_02630 [Methylotenera sp.]|nr:hypothetical protein [Methylotenera sp.]
MPDIPKRVLAIVAIEAFAFGMSVVLGVLWMVNPNGSYEPFLAVTGLLLVATEAYRRYEGRLFRTEGVLRTPSERVHHHDSLRQQFEEEIQRCRREKLRKDVIIRHVNRLDDYPNSQETKGISPWFKVGLLDTYHKGIKVGLGWEGLIESPQGLRKADYKAGERGELNAMLTGEIPYDFIETMNVDGDEYYYLPHIFCHFAHKGEPYERLFYTQEVDMGNGHIYWKEVATYEEVKLNSKEVAK